MANSISSVRGTITEVQRFSVHDGPGIRTTVFVKGCNLHCFWCHNPETHRLAPELELHPDRCIGCLACVAACERHCHEVTSEGKVFHREDCIACGACARECFADALHLVGREVSVGEIMGDILADRAFYANSGGGVTISGGEPLLQPEFTAALLTACREEGIHAAIETAVQFPWERVAAVLPLVDLLMMDIKVMDEATHRRVTGVGNARILENARRIAASGKPMIVRTPVVPGVNDTSEAIGEIAAFVRGLPTLQYLDLLPFHPMAAGKYDSLGRAYEARNLPRPTSEHMEALAQRARAEGIEVRLGRN
ncbi:MAG: glycyl-radical enzyme activating protein [Anaerolineae bacterium]|jgi:pyruvate formate lyase activating enzyme|nr:glycyl-radical enzyme activating protein [Chloroflexota bacterium]